MKTNKMIFAEIKECGFITKENLQLLKNRSNKEQTDLFDYDFMENFKDGYGIPLSEEQGEQGLKWLKKFINKNGESKVYGFREIEIIENASPSDFKFQGFLAWYFWMFLHLMLILSVRNKLAVFFNWMWSYVNKDSSLRLIIIPNKKNNTEQ